MAARNISNPFIHDAEYSKTSNSKIDFLLKSNSSIVTCFPNRFHQIQCKPIHTFSTFQKHALMTYSRNQRKPKKTVCSSFHSYPQNSNVFDSEQNSHASKTLQFSNFSSNLSLLPPSIRHKISKKKFIPKSDEFELEEMDEIEGMDMNGYDRDDDDDEDEEEEDAMDRELDKESDFEEELNMRDEKSIKLEFQSIVQGEEGDVTINRIDESKFHKLKLHACDFFIRKVEDDDNDVYDFQEMYASAPDVDQFFVPKIKSEMPNEPVRCNYSEWKGIGTKLPPIEGNTRKPYVVEANEVLKVFLIKHLNNSRSNDSNFGLDFEEIYVIDGAEKSIMRANVHVEVEVNGQRDRSNEVLIVRDNGTTFRLIPKEKRKTPDEILFEKQWEVSRKSVDDYLRTFRDYEKSNWF